MHNKLDYYTRLLLVNYNTNGVVMSRYLQQLHLLSRPSLPPQRLLPYNQAVAEVAAVAAVSPVAAAREEALRRKWWWW